MQVRRQTPRRFGVFEDLTRFHPSVDWHPDLDIYESPDAFVLLISLPGVAVDDVEVTVGGKTVRVTGSRRLSLPARSIAHLIESPCGHFERRLRLPEGADLSRLSTRHLDGVLVLNVPKSTPGGMTMTIESWRQP